MHMKNKRLKRRPLLRNSEIDDETSWRSHQLKVVWGVIGGIVYLIFYFKGVN